MSAYGLRQAQAERALYNLTETTASHPNSRQAPDQTATPCADVAFEPLLQRHAVIIAIAAAIKLHQLD